jgi:hypothetical protein
LGSESGGAASASFIEFLETANGGLTLAADAGLMSRNAAFGTAPSAFRARAELIFVLLTIQVGVGLLGMFSLLLVMGGPLYSAGSVLRAGLLLWLGVKIIAGRRWAMVTTVVVEWVALLGVWVGVLLGLLPGLTPNLTLTGLLTELALPITVSVLCARQLAVTGRRPDRNQLPHTRLLVVAR